MASDLAGFWDMLQLSIENISLKFDELHQLRANNWRPIDPPERKVTFSCIPVLPNIKSSQDIIVLLTAVLFLVHTITGRFWSGKRHYVRQQVMAAFGETVNTLTQELNEPLSLHISNILSVVYQTSYRENFLKTTNDHDFRISGSGLGV